MKKKVLKIIIIFLLVIIAFGGSYAITYLVDQNKNRNKEAEISVLFDDNEYYLIPNSDILTEEEALVEWPYQFKVTNTGNTDGLYQIIIMDDLENDISRNNLSYILYLNEKEIKKGNLDEIANNVLYETVISPSKEQNYKLYIYKKTESEGTIYQYSIYLNAILKGGPGF